MIKATGAVPGIKLDKGPKPLPFCPGETVTEGLDGLAERVAEYAKLGAEFAKWRAVIDIGNGTACTTASTPMPMRWPATPRSARQAASCRWSSRKF